MKRRKTMDKNLLSLLSGLGQTTQTSNDDVQSVLTAALPSLLAGAQQQATGADTSAGFAQALMSHGQNSTSDLNSFLNKVDLEDGNKILGHLLGSNSSAQINSIAKKSGVSTRSTASILCAAAPLLLSLLGQQSGANQSNASASLINGSVASLLGGALGMQQPQQQPSLLGSLFGGQQPQQQSTSLLGSLFGTQQQQPQQSTSLLGSLFGAQQQQQPQPQSSGLLGGLLSLLK